MYVTVSDAKTRLNELISSEEPSVITKHGKPKAAIIPYDTYIKWVRAESEKEDNEAIRLSEEYFAGKRTALSQVEMDFEINTK